MFLLVFLFFEASSRIDSDGIVFKDEEETILQDTPTNLQQYTIKSKVTTILGGSSDKSAFCTCKNTLKALSFESNSQLIKVEPFAFAFLLIKTIDMSPCTKLTVLEYRCFRECSNLESIILPPNVETIQSGAFFKTGLKSITFPDTLKILEGYIAYSDGYASTFAYCYSLSEVNWGENPLIQSIGSDVFLQTNLTSFRIPSTLKEIGVAAFMGTPIAKFEIDNNDKFSADGGILYNSDKTTLLFYPKISGNYTIPNTVNTLQSSAFRFTICQEVVLPDSLKLISSQCFMASEIVTVTIPSSVTVIQSSAFRQCTKLETIIFKGTLGILNSELFRNCPKLKSISIPSGVATISKSCFMECTSLEEIWIPSSVKSIGESAFQNIKKGCIITFETGSPFFSENYIIYSAGKDRIVLYTESATPSEVTIESMVSTIGGSAFYQTSVTGIKFAKPSSCQSIEENAFYGAKSLTEIEIPNSVTTISKTAFENSGITKVTFETVSVLKSIGEGCFRGTSITTISLPASVGKLEKECFKSCTKLTSVILSEGLSSIGEDCFALSGIKSIQIPSSVTTISEGAFEGSQIYTASIVRWNESLPKDIFKDCVNLHSVNLPEGVTSIGRSSFEGCSSLTSFDLPSTVKVIEIGALRNCKKLVSISIPDDSLLTTIESLAFSGCESLTEMNVSGKNMNFSTADSVLYNKDMSRLILFLPGKKSTEFVSPKTVVTVDAYAFQGAAKLQAADFGESVVEEIGYACFDGCSSLRTVILPDTLKSITSNAFEGCPFGCGSIVHPFEIRQILVDSGIDIESVIPCATMMFTQYSQGSAIIGSAIPVLFEGVNSDLYFLSTMWQNNNLF